MKIINQNKAPMVMEMLLDDPKMILIHDFLSPEECEEIIKEAEAKGLNRSTVHGSTGNTINVDRTSYTANLDRSGSELVKDVEKRASILSGMPLKNVEPLQVCRYSPGQQYKPHYDFFVPGASGTEAALKRGGQRKCTFFVYLNDLPEDDDSGHTWFPKLNIKVRPKKGMATFWMDVDGENNEDFRTLHGGTPPSKGTKYGLNIWVRTKTFT